MLATFVKDPDASLDYGIDWSGALPTGVTISASAWTVPAGIAGSLETFTTTQTAIRISGGTVGTSYEVANRVTLSSGEIDERTIKFKVQQR